MIDVFFITFSLMIGTAGLPHILIRFFTVPKMRDARSSAGWALIFIALLYTTCLLYTSDAADERSSVDLGGRRIIKKKKLLHYRMSNVEPYYLAD